MASRFLYGKILGRRGRCTNEVITDDPKDVFSGLLAQTTRHHVTRVPSATAPNSPQLSKSQTPFFTLIYQSLCFFKCSAIALFPHAEGPSSVYQMESIQANLWQFISWASSPPIALRRRGSMPTSPSKARQQRRDDEKVWAYAV